MAIVVGNSVGPGGFRSGRGEDDARNIGRNLEELGFMVTLLVNADRCGGVSFSASPSHVNVSVSVHVYVPVPVAISVPVSISVPKPVLVLVPVHVSVPVSICPPVYLLGHVSMSVLGSAHILDLFIFDPSIIFGSQMAIV